MWGQLFFCCRRNDFDRIIVVHDHTDIYDFISPQSLGRYRQMKSAQQKSNTNLNLKKICVLMTVLVLLCCSFPLVLTAESSEYPPSDFTTPRMNNAEAVEKLVELATKYNTVYVNGTVGQYNYNENEVVNQSGLWELCPKASRSNIFTSYDSIMPGEFLYRG